jgi:hypothetical protein
MNTPIITPPPQEVPVRDAARNGLAVFGFIALIILGVALGIYSARFVPSVVNGIGAAAVYLGSVFTPGDEPGLTVVPGTTATTTITFATTTPSTATTTGTATPVTPKPTSSKPIATYPKQPVVEPGFAPTPTLYGLPDLSVRILATGYVTVDPGRNPRFMDTFVESGAVPRGKYPAVKFTVKNIGTNKSGTWGLQLTVPGETETRNDLESMMPGQEVTYVLAIDDARTGSDQTIRITVQAGSESKTDNNSDSAKLDIR